jgi:hypothetical protein
MRRLIDNRVALERDVRARHRAGAQGNSVARGREKFVYLSKGAGGDWILLGAVEAGVEDEVRAKANWKLHQQPARAEHALFRNDYYLRLLEAAGRINAREGREVVRVPVGDLWGESHPAYPLRGARIELPPVPDGAFRPRPRYERVIPDGRFVVEWLEWDVEWCEYDVEAETASRTGGYPRGRGGVSKGAIPKIEARAGWMLRVLDARLARETKALATASQAFEEDYARRLAAAQREARERNHETLRAGGLPVPLPERLPDKEVEEERRLLLKYGQGGQLRQKEVDWWVGLGEAAVPVVFLYPSAAQALRMRDRVAEALLSGRMPRMRELGRRADAGDQQAGTGRTVLFCGYDDLARSPAAALARSYVPLLGARDGGRVTLYEAAEAAQGLRLAERPEWWEKARRGGAGG